MKSGKLDFPGCDNSNDRSRENDGADDHPSHSEKTRHVSASTVQIFISLGYESCSKIIKEIFVIITNWKKKTNGR